MIEKKGLSNLPAPDYYYTPGSDCFQTKIIPNPGIEDAIDD